MNRKFTVYGSEKIQQRIASDMSMIVTEMENSIADLDSVEALVLGGGYGRGEGGVIFREEEELTFNDYDFFVVTKDISVRKKQIIDQQFRKLHKTLTPKAGIDVDFGPAITRSQLNKLPFHIMWYELKMGHLVVWGDKTILKDMPSYQISDLNPEEAVKLLLNRATGLLLAREKLRGKAPEDHEFILRNIMKALIAAGDAFLICNKDYSISYRKRVELLAKYKDRKILKDNEVYDLFEKAIEYKLQPDIVNINLDQLELLSKKAEDVMEQIFLFSSGVFLQKDITDWENYYLNLTKYYPSGKIRQKLKNLILNLKYLGIRRIPFRDLLRYPRFQLFRMMPMLLYGQNEDKVLWENLKIRQKKELWNLYLNLWNRFN